MCIKNILVLLTILFLSSGVHSFENVSNEINNNSHSIPLSVSNNLFKSQDSFTDLSLGIVEIWRKFDGQIDKGNTFDTINSYLIRPFIGFQVALWTHEIFGHTIRANDFNVKTTGYSMSSLFGAATHFNSTHRRAPLQTKAIISIGGNEATHDLAEKIKDRAIINGLNPIYASSYFFTQGNQGYYVYMSNTKAKGHNSGHDLLAYSRYLQGIYGKGYMSISKIKSHGFLDLLDPMIYYSAYSFMMNEEFEVPMISVTDNVKLLPAARMVLTPYGIEKQGVLNLKINNETSVKITGSFGNTKIVPKNKRDEYASIPVSNNRQEYRALNQVTKKASTYSFTSESLNLITVDDFTFGGMIALWKQPNIFAKGQNGKKMIDPLLASVKNGGMALVNVKYSTNTEFDIGMQVGYKTDGYIHGYPVKKGVLVKATVFWKL